MVSSGKHKSPETKGREDMSLIQHSFCCFINEREISPNQKIVGTQYIYKIEPKPKFKARHRVKKCQSVKYMSCRTIQVKR